MSVRNRFRGGGVGKILVPGTWYEIGRGENTGAGDVVDGQTCRVPPWADELVGPGAHRCVAPLLSSRLA